MTYPAGMRTWVVATVVGLLTVALVVTSTLTVQRGRQVQQQQTELTELSAEAERLQRRVDQLDAEVQRLREQGAGGPAEQLGQRLDDLLNGLREGAGEALEELLEGDGAGLGELLEGLLDGDGEGGGLGELLEGLLGGSLQGGLDAGAAAMPAGARCLLPDSGGLLDGGLGGLLDGGLGGLLDGGSATAAADPDEVVAELVADVAGLRELDWQQDVEVAFLDDEALGARLTDLLDADGATDPVEVAVRDAVLGALHAVPAGTNVAALERQLLEDSVAGFYVPDTGELVVRVPDDGTIRAVDRITLAHELDHALTDQVLGLPDLGAPELRGDADAQLAALALIEGDATLLMQRWALANVGLGEQLAALGDPELRRAADALEAVPHHLQRQLLFPYTEGLDWVCDRWLEGGWAAVDAAYADPPTTTAEILFGDRRTPRSPLRPAIPEGYGILGTTTLGAAELSWLFEAPGGESARALDQPRQRAAAWAGGQARVFDGGGQVVVAVALVDGGSTGAPPLCTSVQEWYDAAVPDARRATTSATAAWEHASGGASGPGAAVLSCAGDDVLLVSGPDLDTVTTVAESAVGRSSSVT